MAKKVEIVGANPKKIEITDKSKRRIEPDELATALGASEAARSAPSLDLISLAELGTQLLSRLRSSGGRPALADATEICRVPLSAADIKTLEEMVAQIEKSSGAKASVGQLVSAIVRAHLHARNARDATPIAATTDAPVSRAVVQQMLDAQLTPLRDQLQRLQRELHAVQ
ncbi:MAG: hypothetical protein U0793_14940 [Gemmataceae bacterium]